MNRERLGVLLLNLGGPDSLEAVPRFLLNLFRDPDIFRFPLGRITQPFFARMLTWRRTKRARASYAQIGGASPLLRWTQAQSDALEIELRDRGVEAAATPAMRYWRPTIDEAIDRLADRGAERNIVALPLYPHFSLATTGSSVHELDRCMRRRGPERRYRLVEPYFEHPRFVDALSERIREGLEGFPRERRKNVAILFSAHGLPESFVKRGDPYPEQIRATCDAVGKRFPEHRFHLAFQSRVGPVRWIGPSVEGTLGELGGQGVRDLLAVPVSFVSDHIETLYEIDIEYARIAREAGIENFRRTEALNDMPEFIRLLAELVVERTSE